MSENTPVAETAQTAPEADAKAGVESLPQWAQDQLRKARTEAAGYREKLREAEPLVARAKELEEAGKSEAQRLTEALEASKAEAAALRHQVTRAAIVREAGLTDDLAEFLVGDEAAMRAAAAKLSKLATAAKGEALKGQPVEALKSAGQAPDDQGDDFDPAALAASISL
ncbi:hypothetical protein [Kitasatospora sp. NPDC056184]|uniref:hypothetical protein n=1 Tax=Kitasatospora sp. NPDC056184 TaxID=3345738 RepID=UPI0035E1BB1B